jgi:hypothetical protein
MGNNYQLLPTTLALLVNYTKITQHLYCQFQRTHCIHVKSFFSSSALRQKTFTSIIQVKDLTFKTVILLLHLSASPHMAQNDTTVLMFKIKSGTS